MNTEKENLGTFYVTPFNKFSFSSSLFPPFPLLCNTCHFLLFFPLFLPLVFIKSLFLAGLFFKTHSSSSDSRETRSSRMVPFLVPPQQTNPFWRYRPFRHHSWPLTHCQNQEKQRVLPLWVGTGFRSSVSDASEPFCAVHTLQWNAAAPPYADFCF